MNTNWEKKETVLTMEHLVEAQELLKEGYSIPPPKLFVSMHVIEMVPRTWKERLWSWPWKPWVKEKAVPGTKVLHTPLGFMCHPQIEKEVREALDAKNIT